MKNYIKFAFSLLILFLLVTACNSDKSDKDKKTTNKPDTTKVNKDQYRVAEIFTGSKDQLIDLIKGPATFNIFHEGTGHFKVAIKYPDGQLVEVLADVTGDFKGKKQIVVPETRAYDLDVETEGKWSVYRE